MNGTAATKKGSHSAKKENASTARYIINTKLHKNPNQCSAFTSFSFFMKPLTVFFMFMLGKHYRYRLIKKMVRVKNKKIILVEITFCVFMALLSR